MVSHFAVLEGLNDNLQVGIHSIMIKQWIMTLMLCRESRRNYHLHWKQKSKYAMSFGSEFIVAFFLLEESELFFYIGKSNFSSLFFKFHIIKMFKKTIFEMIKCGRIPKHGENCYLFTTDFALASCGHKLTNLLSGKLQKG